VHLHVLYIVRYTRNI